MQIHLMKPDNPPAIRASVLLILPDIRALSAVGFPVIDHTAVFEGFYAILAPGSEGSTLKPACATVHRLCGSPHWGSLHFATLLVL
jgi:hypothetical protein